MNEKVFKEISDLQVEMYRLMCASIDRANFRDNREYMMGWANGFDEGVDCALEAISVVLKSKRIGHGQIQ